MGFKMPPHRPQSNVKSYEQTIFCLKASVTKLSSAPCQAKQIPHCAAHVRQYFSQFVCNYDSRKSSGSSRFALTSKMKFLRDLVLTRFCNRQQLSTMQIQTECIVFSKLLPMLNAVHWRGRGPALIIYHTQCEISCVRNQELIQSLVSIVGPSKTFCQRCVLYNVSHSFAAEVVRFEPSPALRILSAYCCKVATKQTVYIFKGPSSARFSNWPFSLYNLTINWQFVGKTAQTQTQTRTRQTQKYATKPSTIKYRIKYQITWQKLFESKLRWPTSISPWH